MSILKTIQNLIKWQIDKTQNISTEHYASEWKEEGCIIETNIKVRMFTSSVNIHATVIAQEH